MKRKTLSIVTAAIITASVLALTASLSLLNSFAIDESDYSFVSEVMPDVNVDEVSEVVPEPIPEVIPETIPEADTETDIVPDASIETAPEVTPEPDDETEENTYDYPVYEYTVGDPRNIYVGGGEGSEDVSKGVVIDIYSHKDGKLVGQLSFTSGDICSYISQLMRDEFKPENELWIDEDSCQPLPMGDYRIEVYAGTWFSYTYGVSGIFELTQCTLTFSGGEQLTGYIDFLIADLIADIEAGNVEAPAPEMAVSKLIYEGIEGYWEGYYNEVCDMYIPAAGRLCERFPYAE